MRRASIVLFLALALPLTAAEKWFEAYDRGVAAVGSKNYKAAAEALQRAIAAMPNEGTSVRAKNSLITYVPHFWLGIAKFNLGDTDGALREWRISEEQGVIARTDYYARMKDWIARAQVEKQRNARDAASGSKKAADAAISEALEAQLDALSAGGDRADSYLNAQRKLQDARAQFQKAGNDVGAYRSAEQMAAQAKTLFAAALEEGRKLRAARVAAPPAPKKPAPARIVATAPASTAVPAQAPSSMRAVAASILPSAQPAATPPAAAKPALHPAAPPMIVTAAPIVSAAEADRQIAEQDGRRRQLETRENASSDLKTAYRAFARGDVATAERLLTQLLSRHSSAEALLLRGCARYTKAMLARERDALLAGATADFRAALAADDALRLDSVAFSPKLVAFFETVRKQR